MPILLPLSEHLSLSQAATRLDVSRQRVLSLSSAGLLNAVPMGGRMFFPAAAVETLAARLAGEAAPPRRRARTRT